MTYLEKMKDKKYSELEGDVRYHIEMGIYLINRFILNHSKDNPRIINFYNCDASFAESELLEGLMALVPELNEDNIDEYVDEIFDYIKRENAEIEEKKKNRGY